MSQLILFEEQQENGCLSYEKANIHQKINFKSRTEHANHFNLPIKHAIFCHELFDEECFHQQFFIYMYPHHHSPYKHSKQWHDLKKTMDPKALKYCLENER